MLYAITLPSVPFQTFTMAQQNQIEETYHPKDAVGATVKATAIAGTAGTFISAIQNVLTKQNVGAFGIFTRTGSTIAVFGMAGTLGTVMARFQVGVLMRIQLRWAEHSSSARLPRRT